MDRRKIFASLALVALFLASLVGICKQMNVSCGFDCSEQSMTLAQMSSHASDCAEVVSACTVASMGDHLMTFASAYPTAMTSAVAFFFLASAGIVLGWLLISHSESAGEEKRKARLRSLRRHLTNSVVPDFLAYAFRTGILHSKIYA